MARPIVQGFMKTLLRLVTLTVILVSCAYSGPVAEPFDPIPAQVDPLLDVTSSARIEPGFSMGVWQVGASGTTRTLTRHMLVGDEASEELVLAFDFSGESVSLIGAHKLGSGAEAGAAIEDMRVSSVVLNHADPQDIISGRLTLDSGMNIDFWVDMDDGSHIEPDIDVPFEMKPGFVIDEFSFAIQYNGVVDDSRCPPDVTCVWAGEVTLAFSYVDEDTRTTITTSGIATPDGPVYGDNPTIDLGGSRYLEVLGVTDQSATVTIRTSES